MRTIRLVAALLLASACAAPVPSRVPPPGEAERLVGEAEAQARAGAYRTAARTFEEVVKRFPGADTHDRALWGLAHTLVLVENPARDYRQAHLFFDRLAREHPASRYAADARAWHALLSAYLARTEELSRLKEIDLEMERGKVAPPR